jgi:pimeloyl-ACP methyl ester carboxylesterase
MRRRHLLALSAAAPLALGRPATPRAAVPPRRPIVLVHGAWHGGWCWREVAAALRAAGHAVFAPTLTGMGERAHLAVPEVSLATHAEDVAGLIRCEELQDVLLVGHSYAGYVVSLAADRIKPALAGLVYLDALLPEAGQAFLDEATATQLRATAARGFLLPPPGLDFFGVPETHPNAAWVKRRLTPHPLGTLTEPVRYAAGGPAGVAKVFVRCTQGAEQPDKERAMIAGDPEWRFVTLDAGHDAMITAPEATARLLAALA